MPSLESCLAPYMLVINVFLNHQCHEIYTTSIEPGGYSLWTYLPYFLMTLAFELPIYFIFLRSKFSISQIVKVNFILNLATHPFIFLGVPWIIFWLNKFVNGTIQIEFVPTINYLHYLIFVEIFAPVIEALLIYKIGKLPASRAIWAALAANLFSWTLGTFL